MSRKASLILALWMSLALGGCFEDEMVRTQNPASGDPKGVELTLTTERKIEFQNQGQSQSSKVSVTVKGPEGNSEAMKTILEKNLQEQVETERKNFLKGAKLSTPTPAPLSLPSTVNSTSIDSTTSASKEPTETKEPLEKVDPKALEESFIKEFNPANAAAILAKVNWKTNLHPKMEGSKLAKIGGTLVSAASDFPSTLRMFGKNSSTTFNQELEGLCYESLLSFDFDKLEYGPSLAEKWLDHPDKQTFFFSIDPDAIWSDGQKVTAQDVVASWKMLVDPGIQDPFANDFWGKFYQPIALTDSVVVVRSKEKVWRSFISFAGFVVYPSHLIKDLTGQEFLKTYNWKFLPGSGPYTFDSTDKESHITFKRRGDYWGWKKPWNQGLFNFGILKYVFINNETLLRERFKSGSVDWYMENTARKWVQETDYTQIQKGWIQKRRIFTKQPDGVSGLAFNLRNFPFNDIKVRKAIAHLFDRNKLIESLFLNQYFPRNSLYVGMPYENPGNPKNEFNPQLAMSLLKEAGFSLGPDGILQKEGKKFEIDLNFLHNSEARIYTVVQEDLKNVGIKLNLKQVTWATDIKEVGERNFAISSKAYSGTLFPFPEGSLHSKYADLKDNNNIFGYKNPKVDQLSTQYNEEFDPKKRVEICREIDKIVCSDYIWAFGWYAPYTRVLYWNKFGAPEGYLAKYTYGDQRDISKLWWYDEEKSAKLKEAQERNSNLPIGETDVTYWDSH